MGDLDETKIEKIMEQITRLTAQVSTLIANLDNIKEDVHGLALKIEEHLKKQGEYQKRIWELERKTEEHDKIINCFNKQLKELKVSKLSKMCSHPLGIGIIVVCIDVLLNGLHRLILRF